MAFEDELQEMISGKSSDESKEEEIEEEEETIDKETVDETEEDDTEEDQEEEEVSERERKALEQLERVTEENIQLKSTRQIEQTQETQQQTTQDDSVDFLGDTDIDDFLADKDTINKILNAVYRKGIEVASQRAADHAARTVANNVGGLISHHNEMQAVVDNFYNDNPDLKGVKKTVASMASEISRADPSMKVGDVLDHAARRTRELLSIKSPTKKKAPKKKKPVPASKGRSADTSEELPPLEADIASLIGL